MGFFSKVGKTFSKVTHTIVKVVRPAAETTYKKVVKPVAKVGINLGSKAIHRVETQIDNIQGLQSNIVSSLKPSNLIMYAALGLGALYLLPRVLDSVGEVADKTGVKSPAAIAAKLA